jgi:hypothetical protein
MDILQRKGDDVTSWKPKGLSIAAYRVLGRH